MFVFLRRDSLYEHAELFLRIKFLWIKIRKQSWLFLERKFFRGMFLRTQGMQFKQRCQKTGQKFRNLPLNFWKIFIKTTSSLKEHVSWENVSSHVDCWPGSLAEKAPPENWKVSFSKKSGRKIVYWDILFLKRFPWTRRKQKRHSC